MENSNDIFASSTSGISGTVTIRSPDIDPSADAIMLPTRVADPDEDIATTCAITNGSQFVVTGRGGLPMNPDQYSDRPWSHILPDFGAIPPSWELSEVLRSESRPLMHSSNHRFFQPSLPREARQMAIAANGAVKLVAATPFSIMPTPSTCHSSKRPSLL